MNQSINIDVHLRMEKGMYARLVERAQDLGSPLSAVVRDAVVQYFANIPETSDQEGKVANPDDPIWELPTLSLAFGDLSGFNPDFPRIETPNTNPEVSE
jgi:hypothetical protein